MPRVSIRMTATVTYAKEVELTDQEFAEWDSTDWVENAEGFFDEFIDPIEDSTGTIEDFEVQEFETIKA